MSIAQLTSNLPPQGAQTVRQVLELYKSKTWREAVDGRSKGKRGTMSRIGGKDAEQIFAEVRGSIERTTRESLATAKQQALQTGKEVFHYEHLKTFIDPSGYRSSGRLEEHIGNVEYEYYVGKPSLMTLREFAEFIKEIYKWQE